MKSIDQILAEKGNKDMKLAKALNCAITINYTILHECFEEYADQFNGRWFKPALDNLEEGTYYLCTRYGIRNFPDTVNYSNGRFYSVTQQIYIEDVAYIMLMPIHPTGEKFVVNFQANTNI